MSEVSKQSPIEKLKSLTEARIFLPSSGGSVATSEVLNFQMAHAQARDAVYSQANFAEIRSSAQAEFGIDAIEISSSANDREIYLKRPDLGRMLSGESVKVVEERGIRNPKVTIVVADGLSAKAIDDNFLPWLRDFLPLASNQSWNIEQIFLAKQGRVALGDHVAELLQSEMVVICIGERPGLSSTSSMGIYFTRQPKIGRTDESRNCISNIRAGGLSAAEAAQKLHYLLSESFRLKLSGVNLKDDFEATLPTAHKPALS
jgi:ethanolamine ammonia-lyase small subunit